MCYKSSLFFCRDSKRSKNDFFRRYFIKSMDSLFALVIQGSYIEQQRRVRDLLTHTISLEQKLDQCVTRGNALETNQRQAVAQLGQCDDRYQQCVTRCSALETSLEELTLQYDRVTQQLGLSMSDVQQLSLKYNEAVTRGNNLERQVQDLKQALGRCEVRNETLDEEVTCLKETRSDSRTRAIGESIYKLVMGRTPSSQKATWETLFDVHEALKKDQGEYYHSYTVKGLLGDDTYKLVPTEVIDQLQIVLDEFQLLETDMSRNRNDCDIQIRKCRDTVGALRIELQKLRNPGDTFKLRVEDDEEQDSDDLFY
jgi:hypothetical protein